MGAVALFDPTLLARLSTAASRWISTRRGVEVLDTPRYGVDSFVYSRPRLWGAVITLLASYALVVMVWLWREL